jgi:hypothetical protein
MDLEDQSFFHGPNFLGIPKLYLDTFQHQSKAFSQILLQLGPT